MKLKLFSFVFAIVSSPSLAFTLATTDVLQEGWANNHLAFNINRDNCPEDIDELLASAFALWNAIPSSSLQIYLGTNSTTTAASLLAGTATDTPLIICDSNFSSTLSLDADLVAGVGFLRGTSFRPITNGGLILNLESAKNANIGDIAQTTAQVVVAHEIGHVLGLGHSQDTASLMYFTAGSKQNLRLSLDDQNAITYLYPRKEFSNKSLIAGCGMIDDNSNENWWNGNSICLFTILYLLFVFVRKSRILKTVARALCPKHRFSV